MEKKKTTKVAKKTTTKKTSTKKNTSTAKKTVTTKKVEPKVVKKEEIKKEEVIKKTAKTNDTILFLGVVVGSVAILALVIYTLMNLNVRTLTCTYEQTTDGLKMTEELSLTFKDEKVTKVRLTDTFQAESKERKNDWNDIVSAYEQRYTESNDPAIQVTTSNNARNYTYKIIVTADAKNAKKENLEKYNLGGITDTIYPYDRLKSQAETAGFKCK